MPTDETTLERLAKEYEANATAWERVTVSDDYSHRHAAEARLIADALRFRLAALAAPVSEDTARLDELERVANAAGGIHLHNGSHTGCNGLGLAGTGRTLRQAVDDMRAARASVRRFAEVAASLPRGGADV